MPSHSALDKFEEGFIFRISRTFFLVLIILAMLGILGGLIYFLWGVSPTSKVSAKQETALQLPVLTAADIRTAMSHPAMEQSGAPASGTETTEKPDSSAVQYQALMDTLNALLPAPEYPPEAISDKLSTFTFAFSGYAEAVGPLRQLCSILREFPEEQRLAPFNTFMEVYPERFAQYKRRLEERQSGLQSGATEAETRYETTVAEKSMAVYQGLIAVGLGIAFVAFLSIYLVLLSMQRNLQQLASRQAEPEGEPAGQP
ncbi:MAG TPA: hypothetical protein VF889_00130 [Bacteroidota bacterium]